MKLNKIAFVGAGTTIEHHIKAISDIKNYKIELSGIFSRTQLKAKKLKDKYKIKFLCKDLDELYKKTKADILVIVISVENVKNISIEAAKYPWKIFIEKPVGYNYEETKFIKKKIGKKINNFNIALNRAYYGSTLQLLSELNKEKSQRVISIFDQENFYENKKLSKYLMYTNSIHLFTYCGLLARGKLRKIEKILDYKDKDKRYIIKKLIFGSGDVIIFHSIWNMPGPWKIDISTKNNFYSLGPLEKLFIKRKNSNIFLEQESSEDDINFKPGFKKQFINFLENIKKNKKKFNFDFYFETVKIINKYYK